MGHLRGRVCMDPKLGNFYSKYIRCIYLQHKKYAKRALPPLVPSVPLLELSSASHPVCTNYVAVLTNYAHDGCYSNAIYTRYLAKRTKMPLLTSDKV